MYLGEITRGILTSLIDACPKPLLLNGKATQVLNTHYGFDTSVMSDIEEAWEGLNKSLSGEQTVPAFSTFNAETLSPNIAAKLERIRAVIVKQLGYQDSEVTLKDAAVRLFRLVSPSPLIYLCDRSFAGHVHWLLSERRY